jgi:hypothetical protein
MILVQAAIDRAVASMALGGGSATDWQQQLQQAASTHGGDWAGESEGEEKEQRDPTEKDAQLPFFAVPGQGATQREKNG